MARLELRRFRRSRMTRAALVMLTLVPLLYGALYLWAFWDPYGNMHRIPVALVLQDRTATDPDGHDVRAGRDLADQLIDRQVFGWHQADQARAERGLRDGDYQLMLRIPADFSGALVTGPDPRATAVAARPGPDRAVRRGRPAARRYRRRRRRGAQPARRLLPAGQRSPPD